MTWEHIDYRLTETEQAHRLAKFCREWNCGPHEVEVDDKGTCTYIGTRPRTNGMFRIEKGYVSYEVDVKRSMKPKTRRCRGWRRASSKTWSLTFYSELANFRWA